MLSASDTGIEEVVSGFNLASVIAGVFKSDWETNLTSDSASDSDLDDALIIPVVDFLSISEPESDWESDWINRGDLYCLVFLGDV